MVSALATAAIAAIAARPTPSTPGPLHSSPPCVRACHLRFPLPGLLAPLPTFDTPQPHGPFPSRSTSIEACARWHFVHLSFFLFLYNPLLIFSLCFNSERHRPRTDGTDYTIFCAAVVCNDVRASCPCPVPVPVLVPFVYNPPNREIAVATAVRFELQPPAPHRLLAPPGHLSSHATQPQRLQPPERTRTDRPCLFTPGWKPSANTWPDRIANPSCSLLPSNPTTPPILPRQHSHPDGNPSPRIASPPALVAMSTTN